MEDTGNCEHMFKQLLDNTTSIVFAMQKADIDTQETYRVKEEEIVGHALNCKDSENFKKLFIAEYKERIYASIFDAHYVSTDGLILNELERIIFKMYGYDEVYNHKFDPTHVLFQGKFYSFFEMHESKGQNIMDDWQNGEEWDTEDPID